eukprot:gb/GECG01008785.1/.p1 GENE.gb/GECG01008785.1/~~gb/GECG01008785.1/.p1  ORF type:complete len:519 (+),score=53.81 gb/GECG01008785.1/:1-1557(+)
MSSGEHSRSRPSWSKSEWAPLLRSTEGSTSTHNGSTFNIEDLERDTLNLKHSPGWEAESPLSTAERRKFDDCIRSSDWTGLEKLLTNVSGRTVRFIVRDMMLEKQRRQFLYDVSYGEWIVKFCYCLESMETAAVLNSLRLRVAEETYSSLDFSFRMQFLQDIPWELVTKLFPLLHNDELLAMNLSRRFPPESVVHKMQPLSNAIVMQDCESLSYALQRLRQAKKFSDAAPYIIIVDDNRKYSGVFHWDVLVSMTLLSSTELESTTLRTYTSTNQTVLTSKDTVSQLDTLVSHQRVFSAPVVDPITDVPLGYIDTRTLMDIFADPNETPVPAVSKDALDVSFFQSPIVLLYRKRIFWLLFLVLINVGTAYIIGSFEAQLKRYVVLASFIPLLTGMGGNTGSQAAALIIQSLASKDLRQSDYFRALKKEMLIGIMLAGTLGAAGWLLGYVRGNVEVAWIVGFSLACIVILSNFVGYTLPFVAKALEVDPAAISSPMVTTLIDMAGVTIFFLTSLVFLQDV